MTPDQLNKLLDPLICEGSYAQAQQQLLGARDQIPPALFHYHMGFLAHRQLRHRAAIGHYERGLALWPQEPNLHYGLALALLTAGDYERGWREFEWRLAPADSHLRRSFSQPQWTGQDLRGKRILLHAEGGLGDAIHFCRYVPMVAELGATVLLECHPPLLPLLAKLPGVSAAYGRGQPMPQADYHCPFQSLPALFGTTLQTIPNRVPYLFPAADRVERWRAKLGQQRGLRIGLSWCGNPVVWPRRSRTLAIFAPLAALEGIEWHSLQVGPAASEARPAGMDIVDHAADLRDLGETAALAAQMDLIISVDSVVAHLAGALGKPVWVLLPKDACFRYLLERSDSPWYPTMRLFRQRPQADDWVQVVAEIAGALIQAKTSSPNPYP